MEVYPLNDPSAVEWGPTIRLQCPHCGHIGVFNRAEIDDVHSSGRIYGLRICPNDKCNGYLFFIYEDSLASILTTYPPGRIDFDATDIPDPITDTLKEAIVCHSAQCYFASIIMVRKTLEQLCKDKNAQGSNLYQKIESLRKRVTLPDGFMEGLGELRLLGNDAAHTELEAFLQIDEEESRLAIVMAGEILRFVYQHTQILEAIRNRKKTARETSSEDADGEP